MMLAAKANHSQPGLEFFFARAVNQKAKNQIELPKFNENRNDPITMWKMSCIFRHKQIDF